MAKTLTRLKNAWNVFRGRDPVYSYSNGYGYSYDPTIPRISRGSAAMIVAPIYNQIAVDVSSIDIRHVRLDDSDRFKEIIDDELNQALKLSANKDQTGRKVIADAVLSMLDEGVVAIVPYECDVDPYETDSYTVFKIRTAKILEWKPDDIFIRIYDEEVGYYKQMWVPKRICAIIENPFYAVMNEQNSTAQRLLRVLSILDNVNNKIGSNKLDMLIQLPITVRHPEKRKYAEKRIDEIEGQLENSPFGIGFIDSTEKVIQLNRSLENNLWTQAKDLTSQLYSQLGFSEAIFNGTADEKTMLNYNNRTIQPIVSHIVEEMERKWLSKTARSQKQAIRFFKDPFKLVPVSELAKIADTFTRNEIASSNEIRSFIGMKPSDDPNADELRNSNLNHPPEEEMGEVNDQSSIGFN